MNAAQKTALSELIHVLTTADPTALTVQAIRDPRVREAFAEVWGEAFLALKDSAESELAEAESWARGLGFTLNAEGGWRAPAGTPHEDWWLVAKSLGGWWSQLPEIGPFSREVNATYGYASRDEALVAAYRRHKARSSK